MKAFGFPQQSIHQKIGRSGEAFFEFFVANTLNWIYRPVHQESDFGIDGYIDIVQDGNVTGKSIAVQLKHGNSYISKKSKGGIKYEGSNKHLNYYLNLQIPIIFIVMDDDFSETFWVLFDIEETTESSAGWWIEIPEQNKLSVDIKDSLAKIAGESKDYSEEVQELWASSKSLGKASLLFFMVEQSDIVNGDLSNLNRLVKKLTKNKKMTISKRASAEIVFPEYDDDPREIYQIPEIRKWFQKTIHEGFPWFYFLNQNIGISLTLLFFCTCTNLYKNEHSNEYELEFDIEKTRWWINKNFTNLNNFIKLEAIPEKFNEEISEGIRKWFDKCIKGGSISMLNLDDSKN